MRQWRRILQFLGLTLTVSVILTTTLSCSKPLHSPPASLADAQRIYSNTSWYWARTTARLTNLADFFPTFDQPKPGAQISMVSTNRTRILYTELVPRSGLLSWRGQGQLRRLAGVTEPIYSVSRGGPKLQLVGFCTGRIFRVEAEGPSDGPTLSDVIMVATNAWHSIQSANKDTP